MKSHRVTIAVVLLAVSAWPAFGAALDAPTVSTVTSDRSSVTLEVTAGFSGAPGGFTVEWMTQADLDRLGGWPAADPALQSATFTGVPTLNVTPGVAGYTLGPDQSCAVVIGALFDETGTSDTGVAELPDGTAFVFRARAEPGAGWPSSLFGPAATGSTQPQGVFDCTVTVGFWKNHPGSWTRVTSLTLGSVSYSRTQLLSILAQPARGDGLVSLAHQLIAAKLNVLLGAVPPPEVSTAITNADAAIGAYVIPPIGGGWLPPRSTSAMTGTLDSFNSGQLGPGHCAHPEGVTPVNGMTWGGLKTIYR